MDILLAGQVYKRLSQHSVLEISLDGIQMLDSPLQLWTRGKLRFCPLAVESSKFVCFRWMMFTLTSLSRNPQRFAVHSPAYWILPLLTLQVINCRFMKWKEGKWTWWWLCCIVIAGYPNLVISSSNYPLSDERRRGNVWDIMLTDKDVLKSPCLSPSSSQTSETKFA